MATKRFGDELRRLRREAGLNLADLADVLDRSIVFVSEIERGRKNPPPPDAIRKLLIRLGHEEKLLEFLRLAVQARESVEISVKNKGKEVTDLLLALARRCDEDELDEATADKMRRLLEGR